MTHQVQWTAAAPLWDEAARSNDAEIRGQFRQPSILRFATDTFMDDFLALLDTDASRVAELVTQPETWRDPIAAATRAPIDPVTTRARAFARTLPRFRRPDGRLRALPAAGSRPAAGVLKKADPDRTLKLYQPAHQRYYLISACLVCKQAALPDRALDTTRDERVTFVMRRLLRRDAGTAVSPDNPSTYDECAFVTAAEGTGWRTVDRTPAFGAGALEPGEEQLPLFPATYVQDDGRKRRLLAGLIPVARREAYVGAPPLPLPTTEQLEPSNMPLAVSGKPPLGPREILLRSQVIEPWKQLIGRATADKEANTGTIPDVTEAEDTRLRRQLLEKSREQIQTGSWYVLLDFAKYLKVYLSDVWTALPAGQPLDGLSEQERALVIALRGTTASADFKARLLASQDPDPANSPKYTANEVKNTLGEALIAIVDEESDLEAVDVEYQRRTSVANPRDPRWPSFLFPLADPENHIEAAPRPPLHTDPAKAANELASLVDRALPTTTTTPMPPRALAAQPIAGVGEPAWFVIRCVYERPRCGPLEPTVISEPTRAFQLAGFFDPDAPGRPIRIAMPIDTSPAGLRKFDKNTAFMISDMLCGQLSAAKKLTLGDLVLSVLPWPFHKPLPKGEVRPCPDGMMCSFSIPHVTIVALLLLFIFATVLHAIFHWLPWFFTCFSLPGFKAKER